MAQQKFRSHEESIVAEATTEIFRGNLQERMHMRRALAVIEGSAIALRAIGSKVVTAEVRAELLEAAKREINIPADLSPLTPEEVKVLGPYADPVLAALAADSAMYVPEDEPDEEGDEEVRNWMVDGGIIAASSREGAVATFVAIFGREPERVKGISESEEEALDEHTKLSQELDGAPESRPDWSNDGENYVTCASCQREFKLDGKGRLERHTRGPKNEQCHGSFGFYGNEFIGGPEPETYNSSPVRDAIRKRFGGK